MRFVLQLVLRKIVAEEIELDGDEWLQLANVLCDVTSENAGLDALELFLAGPASRIADEIGEGPFRAEQAIDQTDGELIADVCWHLLGADDGYIRWTVARGLNTLVELRLCDDIGVLLDCFDKTEIAALVSPDRKLSFQNSQQWLLMGLARAAFRHGNDMSAFRPRLLALAKRSDVHVINKLHISRCLRQMQSTTGGRDAALDALLVEIDQPPHGVIVRDGHPGGSQSVSDFRFDYEFEKSEVSALARLFNVAEALVKDKIAVEITRKWPGTTSMDFFLGRQRYDWKLGDRFEFYREHIQKHALLDAATSLLRMLPVVIRSYETDNDRSPWLCWRDRYDITFDDGSWLSDRKDSVPQQAREDLLGKRIGQKETLQDQQTVLQKLGFENKGDAQIPLYGRWESPDGVTVSITSALSERKGAIGRCTAFAKQDSGDLWLPEFWDQGNYDHSGRRENPFYPLVWAPERHSIGIDVGDEIAAEGPASRPRLGIDITNALELVNEPHTGDWRTTGGYLALKSEVWGNWRPDRDSGRYRNHNDGELLSASPEWLAATLSTLNRRLVFTVTLWKYRSSRDYDPSSGVKSVLVGLRVDDQAPRVWQATRASKQEY